MSRARFAVHFRETVGMTPLDYLTDWRIGVAQALLKAGKSLKLVAPAVGYMSPTAFTRVFSQRIGASPTEWPLRPNSSTSNHATTTTPAPDNHHRPDGPVECDGARGNQLTH